MSNFINPITPNIPMLSSTLQINQTAHPNKHTHKTTQHTHCLKTRAFDTDTLDKKWSFENDHFFKA